MFEPAENKNDAGEQSSMISMSNKTVFLLIEHVALQPLVGAAYRQRPLIDERDCYGGSSTG